MTNPNNFLGWDYETFPNYRQILIVEIARIISNIRTVPQNVPILIEDTRPVHDSFFNQLVPIAYSYFAGHYRGEDYPLLKTYNVQVHGDPRVGCPANLVSHVLNQQLLPLIQSVILRLGDTRISNLSDQEKLYLGTHLACLIFEFFLRIHPYANGNGHIARFIVQAVLGYIGFWPTNGHWTIEPKPRLRVQYTQCIVDFRNGNPVPLISFILLGYS